MLKKKEKKGKKDKKKMVFVSIIFLVWFGLSQADFSGENIFQDRDSDELTDKEELAWGTDPNNPDSDFDGYSDGVEVRSGYNPIKPSPGDKLVNIQGGEQNEEQNKTDFSKNNLTEEYLSVLANEKGDYLGALRLVAEGKTEVIEENNLGKLSLTEDDLNSILEKVSEKVKLSKEEVALVSESDIIIVPRPIGSAEEVKKKEKTQIENYITTMGYLVITRAPFEINNQDELLNSGATFIEEITLALMSNDFKNIEKLRKKNQEVFEELKKIETPEVIKDFHLKILYIYKYFLEGIDEKMLVNQEDPLAMMLVLGKMQALMVKIQEISDQLDEICIEYGIDVLAIKEVFN